MRIVPSFLSRQSDLGVSDSQRLRYKPRADFGNASCRSKHEHPCYWKNLPLTGLSFITSLEAYEVYHARCTSSVNLTDLAITGDAPKGCRYLVWKSKDGMANQLLSLVSAYVYSLLTNRVMLIATDSHIEKYLCNPFPFSSWLIPPSFPEPQLRTGAMRVAEYVEEVAAKKLNNSYDSSNITIKHLQVYIICCDKRHDHPFFCPAAQRHIADINWIFYQSHEYTVPGFYLIPEFRRKLHKWFPTHDAFTHVARYLLHPQDHIWDQITKFYGLHMDGVAQLLGIQVRAWKGNYEPSISKQIERCIIEQMLIVKPLEVATYEKLDDATEGSMQVSSRKEQGRETSNSTEGPTAAPQKEKIDITVFVASLLSEYRDNLTSLYMKNDSTNNILRVHVVSASTEKKQRTGNARHDIAAITDIWMLSFMHDLVVTPYSTFGSVASGLAGIMPLLLDNYGQDKVEEAACTRNNVAGPCFLVYPRKQTCKLDPPGFDIQDPATIVPEVKFCKNDGGGLGVTSPFYIP
ncbi:hypothetical protein KP509_04G072300 [Ceratopteris richardii]|uniref:Fucosyltransferase n=1 Tax=Ceratopteris richardii TaxID=49495 RepID=A0A8T2V0F7_CERRI|nr:hypothetical protein KP509_04G072300 [Ceratopteris richardii]